MAITIIELHRTDQAPTLTPEEADELIATWESKRLQGGTAITPVGIDVRVHYLDDSAAGAVIGCIEVAEPVTR